MAPLRKDYEVIVVGGGVVGAGVARDLALRGVSTLLVEKKDFSAGTTGTCSGMIHGGIRYLEFDIATTQQSCADAGYIRRMAPHLSFRIPFLMPVYPGAKFGLEIVETVLEAYGRYSPLKEGKPSSRLTPAEAQTLEPGIAPGMKGALTMDEWGIDPFRLVLANAIDAAEHGADVANHTEVVGLVRQERTVSGVKIRAAGSETTETIAARVVVNASGPWSSELARMGGATVRLRPGKGTHVIYAGRLSNYALVAPAIDGREIFMVPHEGCTLLGTTDDDYYGRPEDAVATRDEVHYLMEAAARIFPEARNHRVMRVMTGVRPTLYEFGMYEDKLPREHAVVDHAPEGAEGLISVAGGKLATFRLMAEETTDAVMKRLGRTAVCTTHTAFLPGGEETPDPGQLAAEFGLDAFLVAKLVRRHGSRARAILKEGAAEKTGFAVSCPCEGTLECEVRHAIRHEMAADLVDLGRRARIGWGPCQGLDCSFRCAAILTEERGLPPSDAHRLVTQHLSNRFKGKHPHCEGAQLAHEERAQTAWRQAGYSSEIVRS